MLPLVHPKLKPATHHRRFFLPRLARKIRAHAPAIESHRALASPTRSACAGTAVAQVPSSPRSISSPGAWVVLLPSGEVVCSPGDLHLSPPLSSSSSSGSGTCSTAGAGAGEGGEDSVQACVPPPDYDGDEGDGGGATGSPGTGVSSDGAFAFDHVYSRSARGGGGRPRHRDGQEDDEDDGSSSIPSRRPPAAETTAVLYGVVGSPAVMGFHGVLKAAAEAGTVRYAFRHALPVRDGDDGGSDGGGEMAEASTLLQGYGVVLDVKNMEYQNFDSSDPEGEVRLDVYVRVNGWHLPNRKNLCLRGNSAWEKGAESGMM